MPSILECWQDSCSALPWQDGHRTGRTTNSAECHLQKVVLALFLLFCVSISWPLTLVASRLIRLCYCLLPLRMVVRKRADGPHGSEHAIKTLHVELCLVHRPVQSTYGEKCMYVCTRIPPYPCGIIAVSYLHVLQCKRGSLHWGRP